MRIGVIGSDAAVRRVERAAERERLDVQLVSRPVERPEQAAEAANALQETKAADGILFSGAGEYRCALDHLTPAVPWEYLPLSRGAVLRAALQAARFGSDLARISADGCDPVLLREALESADIRGTEIRRAPDAPDNARSLAEFHRDCVRRGLASVCFTGAEDVREELLAEGIPCVLLEPDEELICGRLRELERRIFLMREPAGHPAVLTARLDIAPDSGRNPAAREWERLRAQNEFRERLCALAQRMDAAFFDRGMGYYSLVSSREMLANLFFGGGEREKLLQFGRRISGGRVWLGVGAGATAAEALSRANAAMCRVGIERTVGVSPPGEDGARRSAAPEAGETPSGRQAADPTRGTPISAFALERLRQVLRVRGDTLSAKELAEQLHMTVRSVHRMLRALEEAGCVTTVGRRSSGKGRPARVIKLTLPEEAGS